jgi:hypothetical protein
MEMFPYCVFRPVGDTLSFAPPKERMERKGGPGAALYPAFLISSGSCAQRFLALGLLKFHP